MIQAVFTPDVVYSHDDIWLLIQNMNVMQYAKENNLLLWQHFVDTVQMETGEVYIDDWDLSTIINKMAERHDWSISIKDGLLSSALEDTQADVAMYADAYRALLAEVIDYATNVVGPHLGEKEMQAVDDKIAPQALDLVNRFGLGRLHENL